MAQLGVGTGSSFPNAIDTRQVYRNGSTAGPDSDTRLDAEQANDSLAAIIAIETVLGAGVNGQYGSLAARLNQAIPGSGGQPGIVTFTNAQTVNIAGTQHNVGQAALLWQLYDNRVPAHAMEPGAALFQVAPSTYNVSLQFGLPLTGSIALGAQSPLYLAAFTNTDTVSVPGTVHQLPSADLVFQVYYYADPADPWQAIEPGSLTVDETSRDVLLHFGVPLTGTLVLSAGGPTYALSFTDQDTLTIPGSVHLLGTPAIIFQLYDDATPRTALADPDVSVDPSTFDIVVRFGVPLSGRLVFAATSTFSGRDFEFKDGGIVNQTATRVRSANGALLLQAGSNDTIALVNRTNTAGITIDLTQLDRILCAAFGPRGLALSGQEFLLENQGTLNVDRVRVFSGSGGLALQAGLSNQFAFYNNDGTGGLLVTIGGSSVVLATFGTRVVGLTGSDFQLRDGGIPGATACGVGTAGGALYLQGGTNDRIYFADKAANVHMVYDTVHGFLGFNTLSPTAELQLSTPNAVKPGGGPWLAPSSRALKEAIEPFTAGLEILLALDPVTYQYNGLGGVQASPERHVGLIAEDVQSLAPYMVRTVDVPLRPDEPPTPQYLLDASALPYLLVNTVKTLHAELQAARQAQQRLEQQVALLAARVLAMEQTAEETAP